MLKAVRSELKSSAMDGWGIFGDVREGFAFIDDDEEAIAATVQKWTPRFIFDIKPIFSSRYTCP